MSKHVPIVTRLLEGDEYELSRIDDEVDAWHESDSSLALHEWLGFTEAEYAIFVERPSAVRFVLAARKKGTSIADALECVDAPRLAARGGSAEEVDGLREWLHQTGRL